MPLKNSKNCVERTMVCGRPDALNKILLDELSAEVIVLDETVSADDRKRHVVAHTGDSRGGTTFVFQPA